MEQSDSALPPAPGNADTAANVEGMTPAPPSTGFGQLWLKTLRMSLEQEVTPESVMERWRERLPMLWPNGGEIYRSWRGIKTGEMAGIDLDLGPVTMSTGVVVDDVSPTSFTLQSPTGHLFAGRISFSTRTHDGKPLAEIEILMRANDPLYELGLKFGGHRKEEHFWAEMLWNLAGLYGERPSVFVSRQCLDRSRRWRHVTNIRHNAAIRTVLRHLRNRVSAPLRRGANE